MTNPKIFITPDSLISLPLRQSLPRRRLLQMGAATLLCSGAGTGLLWAQPDTAPATAVVTPQILNRVARFRSLSQRMVKTYCQIFLQVNPKDASIALLASSALLHSDIDSLLAQPWPPVVLQSLAQVRTSYQGLNAQLVMSPTRESVQAVAIRSEHLLAATEILTTIFEKHSHQSHNESNQLLTMAGRQRFLSQRLAKNYFLTAANLAGKEVPEQLSTDVQEFKKTMAVLSAAPLSSAGIRSEIEAGQMQWVFFEAALARPLDERGQLAVSSTSERLLEVMQKLTLQYEAAMRDGR